MKIEGVRENAGYGKILEELRLAQARSAQQYLSQEVLTGIAARLNVPEVRVSEAASFYAMLSQAPRGRVCIQLCKSPICRTSGGHDAAKDFEELLGIRMGEVTPDGLFSLEYTSCLGACDMAPAARIGEKIVGNLNREKIASALREATVRVEADG